MADEYVFSVDDLKTEMPPQDFRTFTLGDDSVAERALGKAVIWVRGKVLSTGNEYDPANDAVVRECVFKRAVYERFSFAGNESRAKPKLRDLEDLMEAYFGPPAGKNDGTSAVDVGPAAGSIIKPDLPRYGG